MATIRLTQIDGKFPNLALMKLSHWHKANGDAVYFEKGISRGMFETNYDDFADTFINQEIIESYEIYGK